MDINKYHNESKKQSIKNQIVERVDELIEVLDKANSLDYFTIEIKSHEGNLNVDCTLKSRKRVY
ncbi:hypothetical protein [Tepidimicrobium xylanilyticum]